MEISFDQSGDFNNTEKFLNAIAHLDIRSFLNAIAQEGLIALENATPVDTGLASKSWGVEIKQSRGRYTITWTNSDIENGFPVAVMIQYGHGTGNGGYVQGIDYINPALAPIFDRFAQDMWKAVTSA